MTSLRVLGLASAGDFDSNESSYKSLEVFSASNWRYEFFEKDKKYYICHNNIDTLFTLSKSDYEDLTNIKLELAQLTKQNKAENPNHGIVMPDS